MELFATKVRYGSMTRFDPMLEENGGWISSEVPRHNTKMSDVVIEVMAKASKWT